MFVKLKNKFVELISNLSSFVIFERIKNFINKNTFCSQIISMDKSLRHEMHENLYKTDMKHIEANLEKFIQKKEEELMRKRNNSLN